MNGKINSSPTLTPDKICADVESNKMNKKAATELLITLIESSDTNSRIKSIEAFSKLSLMSDKAFRIIENCLISDENALIRNAAAKVMFYNFPKKKNFIPLRYETIHENSPIVIITLLDMFESTGNDQHFLIFKNQLYNRLEKLYEIPKEEINLYLNIEVLYIEYSDDLDFKTGKTWFKLIGMLKNFSNTTALIQRLYYLKLGGKKYTPLPDHSISYLKDNFLKEKSF